MEFKTIITIQNIKNSFATQTIKSLQGPTHEINYQTITSYDNVPHKQTTNYDISYVNNISHIKIKIKPIDYSPFINNNTGI